VFLCATAGFGKTFLLTEWRSTVNGSQVPLVWLSLDESDNDVFRFWEYIIAALQGLESGLGESIRNALTAVQPPEIMASVALLINDIAARLPNDFGLVLEDYHLIKTPAIHNSLNLLLERMPPQMHLIITSRAEPPLALSRLRVRGQMLEIRSADLRFTRAEIAEFLLQSRNLSLTPTQIEQLEVRTEGWIAGLQLLALSLRERSDPDKFITTFTTSPRLIVDYLVEEVLVQLPQELQTFLVQTSILQRMSGDLCNAVTSRSDGAARLSELEHRNMFIVPLDDEHYWYRYHHLFADVLRQNLLLTEPGSSTRLHLLASQWCSSQNLIEEALYHAFQGHHYEQAVSIIARTPVRCSKKAVQAPCCAGLKNFQRV